ncbi:hypothetical protein [Cellulophaga baltica]|uniref:hypothetical protein n=1 Tax=Cellulophaga baltica TaxID=76594 RepID=UPI0024959C17|nr:hypothetical protein [Cellulophaga baltica]
MATYKVQNYRLHASNGGVSFYESLNEINLVKEKVKITSNLGKAKSTPDFWLSHISEEVTNKQPVTGIFRTSFKRWYYGDQRRKKDLIIFEFRQDKQLLNIYLFKDFRPASPKAFVKKFITQ